MSPDATRSAGLAGATEPSDDPLDWLRDFEARHGRALRVLHVGNIANNAYLNAKFLRRAGVEAHVLNYDYYHVMATPEWEEIELRHGHGDDFNPIFSRQDLQGYERPEWFVSGPLLACADRVARLWSETPSHWRLSSRLFIELSVGLPMKVFGPRAGRAVSLLLQDPRQFLRRSWSFAEDRLGPESRVLAAAAKVAKWIEGWAPERLLKPRTNRQIQQLIALFDEVFPSRPDRLEADDIVPYQGVSGYFRSMFRHYDIVQCYATEPIHALLAEKRPYVAFEHGTLRDFTMADFPLHRTTALGYRMADYTFITNGDCLAHARKLGLSAFGPINHPVDTEQHRQDFGGDIDALRREIDGDIILFCPIRHDWQAKGTDVHLRALPLVKERLAKRVKLVLIRWGAELTESEALLESLGCAHDVVWRPSMCRITLIKHMRAADVVLDQMTLPHFGATAPQAIAAGVPVISCYVPDSTAWIIPEPAPILSAFSPGEVADAVARAVTTDWRAGYEARARAWTDTYHHPDNVVRNHLRAYREVLTHDRQSDRAQGHL